MLTIQSKSSYAVAILGALIAMQIALLKRMHSCTAWVLFSSRVQFIPFCITVGIRYYSRLQLICLHSLQRHRLRDDPSNAFKVFAGLSGFNQACFFSLLLVVA